jgi:hypothetical protein
VLLFAWITYLILALTCLFVYILPGLHPTSSSPRRPPEKTYPLVIQHPVSSDFLLTTHQQLQQFRAQLPLLKQQGVNTQSYEMRIQTYFVALRHTLSQESAQQLSYNLATDLENTQTVVMSNEARTLLKRYHEEATTWGKQHAYVDPYDGRSYALDTAYLPNGAGLDQALSLAHTLSAYTDLVRNTQEALFQLHLLEKDYQDHTSYDHVHATDLQLLQRYHLQRGQAIVVSLVEQVMRVYQDGRLQRALYVTTGRQELPTPPGIWPVLQRRSPITFEAAASANSPYWFPNTPIQYALLYRFGGFFIHDASWRGSLGPGTQFPHQDPSGNTPYNENGSHGCINVSPNGMAWLYQHTDLNAVVAIY